MRLLNSAIILLTILTTAGMVVLTPAHADGFSRGLGSPGPLLPPWQEVTLRGGPVVMVLAHPDDETAMGGILGYFQERHIPVFNLYITRGEGSQMNMVNGNLSELVWRRPLEVREACRRYGVRQVVQLREQDLPFADPATGEPTHDARMFLASGAWNIQNVKSAIATLVNRVHARQILTMLPSSQVHAHHQAAALLTLELLREGRLPSVEAVYGTAEVDWYPKGTFDGIPGAVHFPITPFSRRLNETYSQFQLYGAQAHQTQDTGHTPLFTNDEVIFRLAPAPRR